MKFKIYRKRKEEDFVIYFDLAVIDDNMILHQTDENGAFLRDSEILKINSAGELILMEDNEAIGIRKDEKGRIVLVDE